MGSSNGIRGSTRIVELMQMYPEGEAVALMATLGWACAHCGARDHEPLSLAAKRHGNPIKPTITCFRNLDGAGPTDAQVAAALPRLRQSPDPLHAWLRSAK